ncbi:MAG: DEAD/DEAH box helicase family protein [Flavobacteriaceae bacterium]|nr:DEAD/DEAH box helicase family protein [Flavobacteriaceae bacterium]
MKIQFDSSLQFQLDAINAIVDIFKGQEKCDTNFTVYSAEFLDKKQSLLSDNDIGYGNRLTLSEGKLLENIQQIQLSNGLKTSSANEFDRHKLDFTVEMETGTGKTYVYLRTIMEMYRKYGFSKHIIVVPSIPIKEGVYKSLQITKEHFRGLYDNIPYNFFVYDSGKLNEVRDFSTNDGLEIMVINIDAFSKSFKNPSEPSKANIIHRYNDKLGFKPLDLIEKTNPLVFIDEPQTTMSTPIRKRAVKNLNPLAIFRYSATHREKINLMYKLDAVDAYEQKLVKQIEVGSIQAEGAHSKAYIKLLEVILGNGLPKAKIQVDVFVKGKIKRKSITVRQNDDLEQITNRTEYQGYIIKDIYGKEGKEFIDFTSNEQYIKLGQSIGSVDELEVKTNLISKTIEEHLDKEKVLNPKGIKVLSLFFVDKVANYRKYDEEGNQVNGQYADIFEKKYTELIRKPKYKGLFPSLHDHEMDASLVHNGYFSIDKRSKKSNSKEKFEYFKDTRGDTKVDENTYNLIMRDKEKLLSFDSKLRFIFSHSALKEGWDNPNVFQICTLRDRGNSPITPRQQIGRGLRLCVNQNGNRVYGHEVNTLSVMATESYHDFAEQLQKEIEAETGIKFGFIEIHSFADVVVEIDEGHTTLLGQDKSSQLYGHLIHNKYLDKQGKVQDNLRLKLNEGTLQIPEDIANQPHIIKQILTKLKSAAGKLEIKDKAQKRYVQVNEQVLDSEDFRLLWEKVKYKTTFSVNFDSSSLIEKCIESIDRNLKIKRGKLHYTKSTLMISKGGVEADEQSTQIETSNLNFAVDSLPDIVGYLQNETQLTRKTIVEILIGCRKLDYFKINPQKFIEGCIDIINDEMRLHIVDGIKYQKIGKDKFYSQELFKNEELYGYLKKNLAESSKSPYDYVIYDSDTESRFSKELERNKNISVYAKLPMWFKIDTPLGSYNPDWVVSWKQNDEEKLYFVVESKASASVLDLRPRESSKIKCGKQHFEALGSRLEVATDFRNFLNLV